MAECKSPQQFSAYLLFFSSSFSPLPLKQQHIYIFFRGGEMCVCVSVGGVMGCGGETAAAEDERNIFRQLSFTPFLPCIVLRPFYRIVYILLCKCANVSLSVYVTLLPETVYHFGIQRCLYNSESILRGAVANVNDD